MATRMNYGIVGSYSGDTFKNLIRQYSYDRMGRDRKYREKVLEIVASRKKDDSKDEKSDGLSINNSR